MEVIEGARAGHNLYIYNNYIFHKNVSRNAHTYFKCREGNCRARAVVRDGTHTVRLSNIHNHASAHAQIELMRMRAELKRVAEEDCRGSRVIFNEVCSRFPEAARRIRYSNVVNLIYRARRANRSPRPCCWNELDKKETSMKKDQKTISSKVKDGNQTVGSPQNQSVKQSSNSGVYVAIPGGKVITFKSPDSMVKPSIRPTLSNSKPGPSCSILPNSPSKKNKENVQKLVKNTKGSTPGNNTCGSDKLPIQTITLSGIEYVVPQKKFKGLCHDLDRTECDNSSLATDGEDEYTEAEYLEEEYLNNEDTEYTEPEYLEEEGLNNDDEENKPTDLEYLDEECTDIGNENTQYTDAANLYEEDFNDDTSSSSDGDCETIGSEDDIPEFYYNQDLSSVSKTVVTKQTSLTASPRPSGLLKVHKHNKDSSLNSEIENKHIKGSKNNCTTDSAKNVTTKKELVKGNEFPTPSNLNQYGDCLKTRLGRYHFGLTLTDPPCQFFQGVLKGASGQSLAVIFGDRSLFSKFEKVPKGEIGHYVIDTSFRVLPNSTVGVNHMLTINLILQNETIPLWYAIASVPSSELYKRILIEFLQHVLDWPFKSVLLNNDPALCKAVRAVFPDITIYGSWFYYCYGIWQELGMQDLLEQVRTDEALLTGVKMLMVLPYLPPITSQFTSISMLEGFETVKQYALENNLPDEFSKVLNYVAIFWFNKVKSSNFTLFGKQDSGVVNFVELFQLSLLSYLKPDGTVWTLNSSFQSVAKSATTQFNRYSNGKPLMRKKSRGKKCIALVRDNTKKLILGLCDVKTYLEKSTVFCDEILDIFLHPLYPTRMYDEPNYVHVEGWKIENIINQ